MIPDYGKMSHNERRRAMIGIRALNLARSRTRAQHYEINKNYAKTSEYIHLTVEERKAAIHELADLTCSWDDSVLFAEAQDKVKAPSEKSFDFAFEQVVTRFNTFLSQRGQSIGIIVQDNNPTVASRLTREMRRYHSRGTMWSRIERIIETPLFVDSHLTSMVQLADLCAYAVRRFCEKKERDLFNRINCRFDSKGGHLVGIRHFTGKFPCTCDICTAHGRSNASTGL